MYVCTTCEYASSTKLGKCPNCGSFGTFIKDPRREKGKKASVGQSLQAQTHQQAIFWQIENKELARVMQNGVKQGGIYLLGGEPGIGKSTIILQIIQELLAQNQITIGYFTGEEQTSQINERRNRLHKDAQQKHGLSLFHATHVEDIIATAEEHQFDCIIIDSIQTIYAADNTSPAGSPNQVKQCSEKIGEYCKTNNICARIIGHVTKGGEIAGPKYLEHIVDVVLYLEGDRFGQLRFLRCQKNRFGHTDDTGIFEMTLFGLQPVYDIQERILSQANTSIPGNVLTIGLDNGRPVIAHVEVLLNKSKYKFPQKTAIGVDSKRVDLIVAILERYLKVNLSLFDIYINIPGEFLFHDRGLDLAVAVGIMSQYKNIQAPQNHIFLGELGLSGQVVRTKLHDKRVREVPDNFELIDHQNMKNIVEINRMLG